MDINMGKHKGGKKNKILPKHRVQSINISSLESKVRDIGYLSDANVVCVNGSGEKMSEVLLDFAEPLIDGIEDDYRAMEKTISFVVVVWNVSLLPEMEKRKGIEAILDLFSKDDAEAARRTGEDMVRFLLERKERYFQNNKRLIISYEFGKKNGKPWLNVASTV
jgi:hypothetical protein